MDIERERPDQYFRDLFASQLLIPKVKNRDVISSVALISPDALALEMIVSLESKGLSKAKVLPEDIAFSSGKENFSLAVIDHLLVQPNANDGGYIEIEKTNGLELFIIFNGRRIISTVSESGRLLTQFEINHNCEWMIVNLSDNWQDFFLTLNLLERNAAAEQNGS
jgi:hypothetical protein